MGTIAPTYNGGLKYMTLHELITLMILLIGTLGYKEIQHIKYASEYISKLQINQHSLLARRVFSWHNSSTQVFFSGSSPDYHQCWIITGSSSKLDHHWIIIKTRSTLYHHRIIIKVGSSLDHHHHYFYYLNQLVISLNSSRHRKFYKAIPFSC